MKNSSFLKIDHSTRRTKFSGWSLAIAMALGAYGAGGVATLHAQSTTGRIFGSAPAGQTITVRGTSGAHRHSKANAQGRYTIAALPMGTYTVTLEKDEKTVDTRSNIGLTVGGGAEVDFACVHDQCAESSNN
jgi:opacity protein-like surface antigen